MISEPELEGSSEPLLSYAPGAVVPGQRTAETISGGDEDAAKPPRPRGAWLWALGGAVVASAVWAGGLYAYDRMGPDLGGYRTSRNLCLDAEMEKLTATVGAKDKGTPSIDEYDVYERASCDYNIIKSDALQYSLSATYELHKKTDPGTEFDAQTLPGSQYGADIKVERIEGVGERAYLLGGSESYDGYSLVVLDGQAVLGVSLNGVWGDYEADGRGGTAEPDPDLSVTRFKSALIEDTKALVARLQRPA
ncbi:hypothetical protein [Streptomyces sp. NPDC000410]|uniref:hypothetical protein n=1 Tax=Streptomyces sp. NPDC000410 TaxID=3154254 RepID=UPI003325E245